MARAGHQEAERDPGESAGRYEGKHATVQSYRCPFIMVVMTPIRTASSEPDKVKKSFRTTMTERYPPSSEITSNGLVSGI
jgi:hypothetical protein